ncbi:MAG: Abi family protein [Clostridiales bacterium]|nr:Abi family protein [Clostridiales bacterium]
MAKVKTFSDYEQQLYILTSEKQIIIQDTDFAKDILERIGYFPLIGGYKHLFRIPFTKTYKSGTTFEEIVALYEFDANLRELFFKYLLQIERHLRSLMSYYFSEKYGESQTAYLDVNNFNFCKKNRKTIIRLVATLQRATTTTDYAYINHYRDTYRNIPLWVLVNILTFGNLSKMYQVFPQTLQSKICKSVKTVNPKQMGQFLSCLTKFRNVCAHGERLFTYKTTRTLACRTVLRCQISVQAMSKGTPSVDNTRFMSRFSQKIDKAGADNQSCGIETSLADGTSYFWILSSMHYGNKKGGTINCSATFLNRNSHFYYMLQASTLIHVLPDSLSLKVLWYCYKDCFDTFV